MKGWKDKSIAVYYEVHKDLTNLEKVLELLKYKKFNGVLELKSFDGVVEYPIIEGELNKKYFKDFDVFSVYKTNKNFLIHYFRLNEIPSILYYEKEPVWVNLDSINMNIYEFFKKLQNLPLTGFVKVYNRIHFSKSFIFFYMGEAVAGKKDSILTPSVLEDIIHDMKNYPCEVGTFTVPDEILIFYLAKVRYIITLEKYEDLFEVIDKNKMYFIQSINPNEVGFGIFDGDFVFQSDNFQKCFYYEIYEVIKLPEKIQGVDIFDFMSKSDTLNIKSLKDYQGVITYFCPACWSVIKEEDKICPNCGFDLTEFHNMDYEYKLLLSLEHPVKEWRKNVVHVIGIKRLEEAIPYLDIMIDKEQDPFILIEIVDTLVKISMPSVIPLLKKLSEHKYAIVRNKARTTLEKISKILLS